MTPRALALTILLALPSLAPGAPWRPGTLPTPEEMLARDRWVAAHLAGSPTHRPADPGIEVLTAHELVQRNSRRGGALHIGSRLIKRGIFCHAPTRLVVRLPKPAIALKALVGVDSNTETRVGRSSIVFVVRAAGRELARSAVMRVNTPAAPLTARIGASRILELELTDAGDGIHSDQGIWGELRVVMQDGEVLYVDELPIDHGLAPADTPVAPFSFTADGRPSGDLLAGTQPERSAGINRWRDAATGLEVRCVYKVDPLFPVVEWTSWIRNTGSTPSPLIEDLQGADLAFARHPLLPSYEFALYHHNGTVVTTRSVPEGHADFAPQRSELGPNASMRFTPPQGRPSAEVWPYFSVESIGKGFNLAVGWPGCWTARFDRDAGPGLRVRAGQATTRFRLQPGEEVRTPLAVLQFWSGDRARAQNVWRRWMLARNVPRPGGKPLRPMTGGFDGYYFPDLQVTDAGEREYIRRYVQAGLLPDYWWIDAGWYQCRGNWVNTGTWEVDRTRFPQGLAGPIRYAREKGIGKSIVWFEPERVTPGSWLDLNRPGWLLGKQGETRLLDLGNPEARQWATDMVSNAIRAEGIDLYRQDFNMDPLPNWRSGDSPGREGITENRYVQGYLAFWDELLRRHPGLLIDTCASGAHRDDLETLRRSVPLWRSDYPWEPAGMQCQTYGISSWVPYHGTGVVDPDPYTIQSDMAPFFLMSWDLRRKDLDLPALRKQLAIWKRFAPELLGDYWPLTEYSHAEGAWMAWQFDRSEAGSGVVQAFRRSSSPYTSACFPLRGLDPAAGYRLEDLSTGKVTTATGRDLMDRGIDLMLATRPQAAAILYHRIASPTQTRGK